LELPRSAGIPSEALPDEKTAKLGKMTERAYLAKVRYPSTLLQSVLAQPRPKRDMNRLFVRDRRSDTIKGPGSVYAGKITTVRSSNTGRRYD
jgi:hypothetical protein